MKHIALAFGLLCTSTLAHATVTTFTNSTDFFAANPDVTLIEDFEDSPPVLRDASLTSYTSPNGEITFTPLSSYPFTPNLVLTSPGYTNYGPGLDPTNSVILSATGNEDFTGALAAPAYALGFDLYLNQWPGTLTFFNGSDVIATLTFDPASGSGNYLTFAGITSTEGVTGFRWEATNGEYINSGIDNIYTGPLPGVPEPSTWAMMLLGFGAVGAKLRKARNSRQSLVKAVEWLSQVA
jgi:PEP-CTERM motif